MKHNLALLILLNLALYCLGQPQQARGQTPPPKEVEQNFYSHFSDAAKPVWKKEGAHYFVNFSQAGMNMTAKYTLTGNWVSTDIKNIPKTKLLPTTIDYLNQKHSGFSLGNTYFHDASSGKSYYKITINPGNKVLYFHDNGNFWK